MKLIKTSLLTLSLFFLPQNIIAKQIPIPNDPVELRQLNHSLDSLVIALEKKDFDINSLISDPRFGIYKSIDTCFKNSPETKASNAYENAPEEEKQEVFLREYEKYKEELEFNEKRKQIPFFVRKYSKQLEEAEKKYNIPLEIIAALLGIESDFGGNRGGYYPFNVYVSMYLLDCKRNFAVNQLEELLIFCNKNNFDVFGFKSSYAGAIGHAQFLPSSLNSLFIGNKVYDMKSNILSIGNYLSQQEGSLEEKIFAYNKSNNFVRCILELSEFAKPKKDMIRTNFLNP